MIVDTNVVSEVMRGDPTGAVGAWLARPESSGVSIAAITVQEITYGLSRLPAGRRRENLSRLWDEVRGELALQVLPLDSATALVAGELMALRELQGRAIGVPDAQIAATCLMNSTPLVTRNTKDFEGLGIELVNPWN